MPQNNIPFFLDNYLAVIKNSIGSKLFRNFYADVNGKKTDVMRNGELSCAFYVSSILTLFKLIKEAHATVDTTLKDLRESGWIEIDHPKIGSIIVWGEINFGGDDAHKHIGFFIGDNKAVSNSYEFGYPAEHNLNFDGKRKIGLILWNTKLG